MSDTCFFDLSQTPINEVISTLIKKRIAKEEVDAFSVLNLSYVKRQILRWRKNFPNIEPFYAVKANDKEQILQTVAITGGSFDCASQSEMERVLALGVPPARIVYANPVRCRKMLEFARTHGIDMLTADCATELHKIAAYHPSARIIVRILPPLVKTNFWLGKKFGLPIERLAEFVQLAKPLKLNLVGVSFHCGSPFQDADAVARAVPVARRAFDALAAAGFEPYILDIGGGFPGNEPHMTSIFPTIEAIAKCTRAAIDHHFPGSAFRGRSLKLMAEPGQYLVYSAQTIVTRVIGKKRIEECVDSVDTEPDRDLVPRLTLDEILNNSGDDSANGSLYYSPSGPIEDNLNGPIEDSLNGPIEDSSNGSIKDSSSGPIENSPSGPIEDIQNGSMDDSANSLLSPNESLDEASAEATNARKIRARSVHEGEISTPRFVYFLNHGRYGHFVFIKGYLDDTLKPLKVQIEKEAENKVSYPSIIYGPTCDTLDIIMENVLLPELEIDNWIYFEGMGAYTNVVACQFNGFPFIHTVAIADTRDPELGRCAGGLQHQKA